MSASTTIDSAMAAVIERVARSSLHGARVPLTMPFYAPQMAGHKAGGTRTRPTAANASHRGDSKKSGPYFLTA